MPATIGARVELDGSEKFRKAMSELTQGSKTLAAQMKALKSSFSEETSAEEKNQQIKKQLTSQIDVQKQRISLLKDEIRRASAEYGENSQQVNRLKEQLAKAETALNGMERDLMQVNEELSKSKWQQFAETAGARLNDVGSKMKSVGSTMSKFVTAPIVAGAALAVSAFNEVDAAMDTVATKTGATGAALAEMQESVKSIATTIPVDFQSAADAVGEVNTRFGLTGDALEELSTRFVEFAKINDTDVSDSIDQVQKALSAYGLSAQDAGHMLDVLNATGQATGVSVDKLTQGLVTNGTAFQEMGLSVDQAIVFMGQLEKSGANSETVLNGMRKALKNATKEGKPLNEALSELQETILNGTNGMDGLTASYDLFGKSGDQIYGAVRNGTIDFNALGDAALNAAGSVEQTFNETLDPMDKFTIVLNELKVLGAEIGGSLGELLLPLLKTLAEAIKGVTGWLMGLDEGTRNIILTIIGVVAAIGPVLGVVGSIIEVIGTILPMISAVGGALSTLAAGPVGIIIAAIGAVVMALITLYNTNEDFRNFVDNAWKAICDSIGGAIENAGKFLDEFGKALGDLASWVGNKLNEIGRFFQSVGSAISGAFNAVIGGIQYAFNGVVSFLSGIPDRIAGFFMNLPGRIIGFFQDIPWHIQNIFAGLRIELPHIALPHFNVSWWDIGAGISLPTIGIDWYAKAMDRGMILDSATIFGAANGRLLGAGEAGSETVVGTNSLMGMIQNAVGNAIGGAGREVTVNMVVNASDGMDVRQLADEVSRRIQAGVDRASEVWR